MAQHQQQQEALTKRVTQLSQQCQAVHLARDQEGRAAQQASSQVRLDAKKSRDALADVTQKHAQEQQRNAVLAVNHQREVQTLHGELDLLSQRDLEKSARIEHLERAFSDSEDRVKKV
jgi:formate-dependent nitrite reductase cytochrome c552 subunit